MRNRFKGRRTSQASDNRAHFGKNSRRRHSAIRGGSGARHGDYSRYIRKAVPVEREVVMPRHSFKEFVPDARILKNIETKGYKNPTPIQDEAIPVIREGYDFVGIANTGTGKTAAFLLPLLEKVVKDKNQKVLILAPTRELAIQINRELISFALGTGIWSVSCIGGDNIGRQIRELHRPHSFVVGTPGRIKDLH